MVSIYSFFPGPSKDRNLESVLLGYRYQEKKKMRHLLFVWTKSAVMSRTLWIELSTMYTSFIVQSISISVDEEGKIPPPADLPEPTSESVTPNPDPVSSNPDPITVGSWIQDSLKSTMWLGTEDGW